MDTPRYLQIDTGLPPTFFIYRGSVGERPLDGKPAASGRLLGEGSMTPEQSANRNMLQRRQAAEHRIASGLFSPDVFSIKSFQHQVFSAQVLVGFLCLRDLGATCLRTTGRMFVGAPAAATGSGPARKNTRQPGDSSAFLAIMQAVTRSTSGISELQSRKASPLQACCSSAV
jgi:hypothetical protein